MIYFVCCQLVVISPLLFSLPPNNNHQPRSGPMWQAYFSSHHYGLSLPSLIGIRSPTPLTAHSLACLTCLLTYFIDFVLFSSRQINISFLFHSPSFEWMVVYQIRHHIADSPSISLHTTGREKALVFPPSSTCVGAASRNRFSHRRTQISFFVFYVQGAFLSCSISYQPHYHPCRGLGLALLRRAPSTA